MRFVAVFLVFALSLTVSASQAEQRPSYLESNKKKVSLIKARAETMNSLELKAEMERKCGDPNSEIDNSKVLSEECKHWRETAKVDYLKNLKTANFKLLALFYEHKSITKENRNIFESAFKDYQYAFEALVKNRPQDISPEKKHQAEKIIALFERKLKEV